MTRYKYILVLLIYLISFSTEAQQFKVFSSIDADQIFEGAELVRYNKGLKTPDYVKFKEESQPSKDQFFERLETILSFNDGFSFEMINTTEDRLGFTHIKFQQTFNSIPIHHSRLTLHINNQRVVSFNGVIYSSLKMTNPSLSKQEALNISLQDFGASVYKWELESEESFLKAETGNDKATYQPNIDLVFFPDNISSSLNDLKLCFRLKVYAHRPLGKREYFIDANSGEIVFVQDLIHTGKSSNGSAVTAYSGNRSIITDSLTSVFRLRDSTRGISVETYDMNNGTGYGGAVDFVDSNNIWDSFSPSIDQYATDAHWGTERTYDYFLNKHNRNSIDGQGFSLKSYVHYRSNYVNAFWDGQRMTYGDGDQSTLPLTSLDIVAHEVTHGLTEFTSGLIYANESGALNESFSDIFGTAVEFYARPTRSNWSVGEDIGGAFRSMSNPNLYGDPDTYGGINWIDQNCIPSSSNDKCGVHTNSGVQNFWFYLLSTGSNGTNDNGDNFQVDSLGIDKAAEVAFRNNTFYLTPSSDYEDARFYSIVSAADLFGACSFEVEAVTDAWHAVGVGQEYQSGVVADFVTLGDTLQCAVPTQVAFQSNSNNVFSFNWDFGNGNTSTQRNPINIYANEGNYDIQLIVDGGACGSDTIIKTSYIKVDSTHSCTYFLKDTVKQEVNSCSGRLFDSGGFGGRYTNDESGVFTIKVDTNKRVQLDFQDVSIEPGSNPPYCNYDYIEVFDGEDETYPSMGRFCATNFPANPLLSTTNALTIVMNSDEVNVTEGFLITWDCIAPQEKPTANFNVFPDSTCDGLVKFQNTSTGMVDEYQWDFGDGSISSERNPEYVYDSSASYDVRLIVKNSIGSDTLIASNVVNVNRLISLNDMVDTLCVGDTVRLYGKPNVVNEWFGNRNINSKLHEGDSLQLDNIRSDRVIYHRTIQKANIVQGAPFNNIGNGGYSNENDYLIFNAKENVIIHSMIFFSNRAGIRTIDIRDSKDSIIYTKELYIPNSPIQLPLDIRIFKGNSYKIMFNERDIDLYRNTDGANYPYNIGNLIEITGNGNGGNAYPYFYRWRVSEFDCTSTLAEFKLAIDSSCGLTTISENTLKNEILFYPNPFSNKLNIDFDSNNSTKGPLNLKLLDISGKTVYEFNMPSLKKRTVDLSFLPSGIYFLQYQKDFKVRRKKLIKMN